MKVILKLQTNTNVNEIILEGNSSIVIGRSSRSQLKVSDELMSSTHCQFTLIPPKLEVLDLNSKNGTHLNGIRIDHSEIFLGDEIKIGSTRVTIDTEKMDRSSLDAITFPGKKNERIQPELRLDFAGARLMNQKLLQPSSSAKRPTPQNIDKEIETRIKANSKIKLSKQEIRLKNKKLTSLASTFDSILMIFSAGFPLLVMNLLVLNDFREIQINKWIVILIFEIVGIGLVYLVNFKILSFSFGEKLAGLQKKYTNQ